MDVSFNDDLLRARTETATHNLAVLRHITLNLIRFVRVGRKDGVKDRRLIAAPSDAYRAELLGLDEVHAIALRNHQSKKPKSRILLDS